MRQALHGSPFDGGVGGNHAVHALGLQRGGDDLNLPLVQVRRDLQEHRHVPAMFLGQLDAALAQGAEQAVQRFIALQRAQVLRVGAGDVDGDIVGVRVDAGQADQVVVHRPFDRRGGVLADVQPQDAAGATEAACALHVGQEGLQPLVVEAQAVDQRAGVGQAEHARLGVAGLAQRGDRADLDEAEAHRAQPVDAAAVLVQPGGQPDAVGKTQSGHGDRIVHPGLRPQALQRPVLEAGDALQGELVGGFGVHPEEERAGEGVGDEGHNSRIVPDGLLRPGDACWRRS